MTQPLGNCPGCGGDEPFEQVHPVMQAGDGCPDSDGECLEWLCSACGTGVIMGTVIVLASGETPRSGESAGRDETAGSDPGAADPARRSFRAA